MIHVLCLNPAVDRLYRIDGFRAGEVYTGQVPSLSAGGKGVNVARVLSALDERVRLYAFLGETGGERIREALSARCDCAFVTVPGACRETVNIADGSGGRETVVSEAGPRVSERHVAALLGALDAAVRGGDLVCCSGSVISGAPADIYARISRLCAAKGALCALDCNARSLAVSLNGARYALLKPNAKELAAALGGEPPQDAREAASMARALLRSCDALLVSLGADGGVYVSGNGALCAGVPKTDAASTVGCGDA